MTDLVNSYFKQFYPNELTDENFTTDNWEALGPMRRWVGPHAATIFPAMVMTDGFSMSVQGHNGAYSSPRDDFAPRYSNVEVGFPSTREELLMPYIDGDSETDPTNTVYGYVPVEVVEQIIAKHGGLAEAGNQ